jgi:hypothetical protein
MSVAEALRGKNQTGLTGLLRIDRVVYGHHGIMPYAVRWLDEKSCEFRLILSKLVVTIQVSPLEGWVVRARSTITPQNRHLLLSEPLASKGLITYRRF